MVKGPGCQCRRYGFNPWVGKIPWRRKWQPTPVFLPEKSHGGRSLAGYSPWGHKESDMTERLSAHIWLNCLSPNWWVDSHWEFPRGVYWKLIPNWDGRTVPWPQCQVEETPSLHSSTWPLTPAPPTAPDHLICVNEVFKGLALQNWGFFFFLR